MWISILISCGITIIFMALKEIYDSKNKDIHSVEMKDIIAGIGGIILGLLLKLL